MKVPYTIILTVLLCLTSFEAWGQTKSVSPYDYGWREATSDSARFWVLYNTHSVAVENHWTVCYQGLDTLDIEIPSNAKSIPLGPDTNYFSNVVFRVKNTHKNLFLFSRINTAHPISVHDNELLCQCIANDNFSPILDSNHSYYLVQIIDSNAWVGEREGHAYGHYREDLFIVGPGTYSPPPIAPYLSHNSQPRCKYVKFDKDEIGFYFGGLTFIRDSLATHRTYLLNIESLVNPAIKHIKTITPASNLVDDCILRIYHCYFPHFDSIHIHGSYSRPDRSGYGILMNNCVITEFHHLFARTPWGVFGTNNMNDVHFADCDFDRFDIHCYGKHISFDHCKQQDSYNQFSSTYGIIQYDRCQFTNFTPVLIENSYNAYNHFELWLDSCTWHLTPERNYLMDAGKRIRSKAIREELEPYCLPSVRLENTTITADKKVRKMQLFRFWGKPSNETIHATDYIELDNISCPDRLKIELTEHKHKNLHFENNIELKINNRTSK